MIVTYEQEKGIVRKFLKAIDMRDDEAEIMADSIADADFTGMYSHGLSRFAYYLKWFDNGAMNLNADLDIIKDDGNTVVFDFNNGSGVIQAAKAYDIMAKRAKEYGLAMCVAKRSSNVGCASYFARKAVGDDLLTILCSNTGPVVAPFGGADPKIGTDPLTIAFPAGEHYPLILDIATSVAAYGKIHAAAREGKEIPLGWALDKEGNPTSDPTNVGSVLPFGAHKGYGIEVMIELFSAVLAGANYAEACGFPDRAQQENIGFSMILIDPTRFMPIDQLKASVDKFVDNLKASRKAPGVEEILVPGEIEYKRREGYMKNGYDIPEGLCKELFEDAVKYGILKDTDKLSDLL